MNIQDKIESELLDGTKITYTLGKSDMMLLDGTKITCALGNTDTNNTISLDGTIITVPIK